MRAINSEIQLTVLCTIFFTTALCLGQKPTLVVQTGHLQEITCSAFSSDGKVLATGSDDGGVKLWSVGTGNELASLPGHKEKIRSLIFTSDSRILISSDANAILFWDLRTGQRLEGRSSFTHGAVPVPPYGKFWVRREDHALSFTLLEPGTQKILYQLPAYLESIAVSPDEKILATRGLTEGITLWDTNTFSVISQLPSLRGSRFQPLHRQEYSGLMFSPDGKYLAADNDLWDVSAGTKLRSFRGDIQWISRDGKTVATDEGDGLLFHDISTGADLPSPKRVPRGLLSADGGKVLTGKFEILDTATGKKLAELESHSNGVASVEFTRDGKGLITKRGRWGGMGLWDLSSGAGFRGAYPQSSALSNDGRISAVGVSDSRGYVTMKLVDAVSNKELGILPLSWDVDSFSFSPDGRIIVGFNPSRADPVVRVWDVASCKEIRKFDDARAIAFSRDGKYLAGAGSSIHVWEINTGREIFSKYNERFTSLLFSPDGKRLCGGRAKHGSKNVMFWDLSSGAELPDLYGWPSTQAESLAFNSTGTILAVGISGFEGIVLWDCVDLSHIRTIRCPAGTLSLTFSPDNNLLLGATRDGRIAIWDVSSGEEMGNLVDLDYEEWLVATQGGLFDGSTRAWGLIIWRFAGSVLDFVPVEAFFSDFYYPGLLADIFAGKNPKSPSEISQKDRRQPQLKLALADPRPETALTTRKVAVRIDVSQAPAGAQDVRLFRNGSLVKFWEGDVLKKVNSVTLTATIPIVAGANRLTAYAFNHDNIKSADARLVINGAESLKRPGTAYILAVGVNSYSNSGYNLKYAVADAQEFSSEVKRRMEAQKRYAQVEVIPLADSEATKANITQKLTQLVERVQPEDTVIVYFAGHGMALGDRFYLIPHDLGYTGPRARINEAGLQSMRLHSISDIELDQAFEKIDAGQILLVIDACNSGQALEAEEKRRGPMNSKGLAQLAYEKGMYILTAAQSYQAAQEAAKLGHGFLTYALVEDGLKRGAADGEPKDGRIELREWLNFATNQVPRMQEENMLEALRGRGRFINFAGDGTGARGPGNSSVQRPRIFYRRELESNPLIVAILGATPPQ